MTRHHPPSEPGCSRFEKHLSAYLLDEVGEPSAPAPAEIAAHLDGCARCREELRLLERTVEAVQGAAPAIASLQKLEPGRRAALRTEAQRTSRATADRGKHSTLRLTALAAAAVLLVALVPALVLFLASMKDTEQSAYESGDIAMRTADVTPAPATSPPAEQSLAAELAGKGDADVYLRELRFSRAEGGVPEGRARKEVRVEETFVPAESDTGTKVEEKRGEALSEAGDTYTLEYGESLAGVASSRARTAPDGASRLETGRPFGRVPREGAAPDAPSDSAPDSTQLAKLGPTPSGAAEPDPGSVAAPPGLVPTRGGDGLRAGLESAAREERLANRVRPRARSVALQPAPGPQEAPLAGPLRTPTQMVDAASPAAAPEQTGEEPAGSSRQADTDRVARTLAEAEAPRRASDATDPAGDTRGSVEGDKLREDAAASSTVVDGRSGESVRSAIDTILSRLDRRSGETPDMMFYRYWGDNPFVETSDDNLSTFAVDVDTATYTLLRSYITKRGVLPPPKAIRTEEMVNYFKNDYAPPTTDQAAFSIHTELAPSPFPHEPSYRLLKVGIKGREISREERKPCALVFVVDTSGSMRRENRLELVKEALRLLVRELDEGDSIGIVAFDTSSRKVLDPTPGSEKERIVDAIGTLSPNRSTNVHAGLTLGYDIAAKGFLPGGSNRVILLSDGVANTSITDPQQILREVADRRAKGIYLTCVGVGMGNHNDALMEQLADRGDGQCVYVDRLDEAKRVFVENLTGTLEAIARDVKVQVEFDKEHVLRYRLLGYENRAVADSDFRNNAVDAGEVGAGHEVTALYELKPITDAKGRIATVRVRYLTVEEKEAIELEHVVGGEDIAESFESASPRFRLTALIAEFAEILRDSYWARGSDLREVARRTAELCGEGPGRLGKDPDILELVALMERADALVRQRRSAVDEVAQVVDMIKENNYVRYLLEDGSGTSARESRAHLEELQRQQAALRRRLETLLDSRPR